MIVVRSWSVALLALALTTAAATAQAKVAAKSDSSLCKLEYDKPDELKDAQSQLAFAQLGKADAQKKSLTKAVEKLSRRADYYGANPLSQQFLLGEAMVLWFNQPGEPPIVRRGDVGFLGEREQTIDLLKAADSLFSLVERALPPCGDETAVYRRMAWVRYINVVGPLINADKLDSAQKVLDASLVIYRDTPYAPYFQGQIFFRRGDYAKASQEFERASTSARAELAKDSAILGVAEYSGFFAGYAGLRAVGTLPDAEQPAASKRVGTLYAAYLKNYPCGTYAENASTGMFRSLTSIGDTAAIRVALEAIATETKPCSDMWWYNAARKAGEIDASALAVTLADKAVVYSPYSAGLGNAAAAYYAGKAFSKLLPVARRLTQIAPNSQDDWQMVAIAYNGLMESASTPAAKKAYNDSLVTAYNTGENLNLNMKVTEFSIDGPKRTLGGTLALVDHTAAPASTPTTKGKGKGKGAAPAQPPAATPASSALPARDVTVRAEFLDRSGAVVAKDSAVVSVKADAKGQFSLSVQDPKIVGYRFAPIP